MIVTPSLPGYINKRPDEQPIEITGQQVGGDGEFTDKVVVSDDQISVLESEETNNPPSRTYTLTHEKLGIAVAADKYRITEQEQVSNDG